MLLAAKTATYDESKGRTIYISGVSKGQHIKSMVRNLKKFWSCKFCSPISHSVRFPRNLETPGYACINTCNLKVAASYDQAPDTRDSSFHVFWSTWLKNWINEHKSHSGRQPWPDYTKPCLNALLGSGVGIRGSKAKQRNKTKKQNRHKRKRERIHGFTNSIIDHSNFFFHHA